MLESVVSEAMMAVAMFAYQYDVRIFRGTIISQFLSNNFTILAGERGGSVERPSPKTVEHFHISGRQ